MQAVACPSCQHWNPAADAWCARCSAPLGRAPADNADAGRATQPLAPPKELALGAVLGAGRYRISGLLGSGAAGDVYRAEDLRLLRQVALKVMHLHVLAQVNGRARALQEATALALIDHPHVVRIFDRFDEEGRLVLVLELVSGGNLADRMAQRRVPPNDAYVLLHEIALGLSALHAASLVHRDVKPANVLLSARGVAKLADLGVAQDGRARRITRLGARFGTPEYMAPEQHRGEDVDARTDVYAAGVLAYELFAGQLPFVRASEHDLAVAHIGEAPDLAPVVAAAGPECAEVVRRALAKLPEERWPGGASLASAWAVAAQRAGHAVARQPNTPLDDGPLGPAPAPAVVAPRADGIGIDVLTGPRAGQRLAFEGGRLSIGRRDDELGSALGRVEFDDPAMSWAHCTFVLQPDGRVVVYDDGALNGTWIDGVRVHGGAWVPAGAVVAAGRTRLAVAA
ncbi:MAG: FHA domain-containing protein [Myxococcales bacterium]|nr:FHA domain-containing protein [Myxococcales bacterium]